MQDQLKQRLEAHLTQIVRERDPDLASGGHFYVQEYIRQQLGQWGRVDVDSFKHRRKPHQNLILNLPGTGHQPEQPILVGAHFDAVPGSPGADDNATGVAVLLELARALAQQPGRYPVRLVAFDLEEWDRAGSRHYAARLKQQHQSLRLMVSLEMLGYCDRTPGSQQYPSPLQRFYPDRGDFIGLIGNWLALPELAFLCGRLRQNGAASEWLIAGQKGHILPATRRSDHASFWDQGYRALMVTDTADLRNPHYHRPSDRLETLDLDFLTAVCRGLITGIRYL